MKKFLKKGLSFFTVIIMMVTIVSEPIMTVEAAVINEQKQKPQGHVVSEIVQTGGTVQKRLSFLQDALVGKYFTANGTGVCPSHSGANCPNCRVGSVARAAWFKNAVKDLAPDYDNADGFYHYYYGTKVTYGTQCAGFVNLIGWCLFAKHSADIVNFSQYATGSFSQATIDKARPGDILALGKSSSTRGHSVIYLSHDSTGVTVFDANYNPYLIQVHKIEYNNTQNWKYVTISRADSYDEIDSINGSESINTYISYYGSDFTDDSSLAKKLDAVFAAYKPNSGAIFPAMESINGQSFNVNSATTFSRGLQYSRWCAYQLFGYLDKVEAGEPGKYSFTELLSHSDGVNLSINELTNRLRDSLKDVACGSHLRISYHRSFIVLWTGEDSIFVLDADWNGDNKVQIREMSYYDIACAVKDAHNYWDHRGKSDVNVFVHQPV